MIQNKFLQDKSKQTYLSKIEWRFVTCNLSSEDSIFRSSTGRPVFFKNDNSGVPVEFQGKNVNIAGT